MSSKILPADSARVVRFVSWPVAGASTPQPALSLRAEADGPNTGRSDPAETAQLQQRVVQLQQRLETEVRSARDQAMREGEKLAREQAGVEIKAALDQVSRSLTDMASLRGRIRRDTEKDLIALSLEIARRVLHRELSVDPDAIQGIARFALEKVQSRDLFRVRLHPAHERQFREVTQGLGNLSGVEVKADPALPLGGVVLETRGGDLDASIDTQLAEISRGFADIIG